MADEKTSDTELARQAGNQGIDTHVHSLSQGNDRTEKRRIQTKMMRDTSTENGMPEIETIAQHGAFQKTMMAMTLMPKTTQRCRKA